MGLTSTLAGCLCGAHIASFTCDIGLNDMN